MGPDSITRILRVPQLRTFMLAYALLAGGCDDPATPARETVAQPAAPVPGGEDPPPQSLPLAATAAGTGATSVAGWRLDLLDEAFAVASSIPEEPHLRDRAKAQEWCASAALTLDQVDRALQYAERMSTWRQATMLADIAGWHAERGDTAQMEQLAERALSLAPTARDWQQERIRVHAARAYAKAGRDARAAALASGVGEAERGKVEAVVAGRGGPASDARTLPAPVFTAQMDQVDEWIMTLNFDLTRNAAEVCIALYRGCQDNPERCARVERSITAANGKLPPDIRIANLLALAEIAESAGHRDRAVPMVEAAEAVLNSGTWMPEDEIVQIAAIALGKHAIGRSDEARTDLAQALAAFDERRDSIIDIYRAAPLRAVAVTQARMGQAKEALQTFRRAVEEGTGNPNARPRAEDLAETCVAMSVSGVDPGDEGRRRIRQIREGLKDPW
ncbi:MAG: hypothetical protein FGM37_01555 [Phycisphaerales bacterium]|nr:hypothetical protein [Phycisphaerales bacterium]